MHWLNYFIRLNELSQSQVVLADMYSYVAILLLSHATGFSFERIIEMLKQTGHIPPSFSRIRFAAERIKAYSPTRSGDNGGNSWISQRDQTRQLSEFENLAFRWTRKVFSTLSLLATLDDDLFGTRAAENQVRTLSNRKADKEGHSADDLAHALLRFDFALRFRYRGELHVESMLNLLSILLDGCREEAVNKCIITADRGYRKDFFVELPS